MLPNSQNPPAGFSQRAIYKQSSLSIGFYFLPPKFAVALWFGVTARAAVPKTAVNKHCQPQFQKNKIRFSEKPMASSPAGDACIFH
jgi:hypothetical protein